MGVEVYIEENAKDYKFNDQLMIRNKLQVDHGLDFLEYTFSVDGLRENEIAEFLKYIRLKKKYYKAALNRFMTVLSKYPDVGVHYEALQYIAICEATIRKQAEIPFLDPDDSSAK